MPIGEETDRVYYYVPYVVYDQDFAGDAKPIIKTGMCHETAIAVQATKPGHVAMLRMEAAAHDGTHYVLFDGSDYVLTAKPVMPVSVDKAAIIADGLDEATISGVPVGAEATVRLPGSAQEVVVVDDGAVEVSSEIAGTITVELRAFPYLDWSGEVVAA